MHAPSLGITVTTASAAEFVFGIASAARDAGIHTEVFLTGDGVHVTQHPQFVELMDRGRVGVCEVSFIARGYKGKPVPGLGDKDFVTQERNAEMLEHCDRYFLV